MKRFGSGNVQDKIINRLERQEKQEAFQRERFFRFKLPEIHRRLSQTLLMDQVIETDNPTAVSDLLLKGLKQGLKSNEFELKYFVAPIRDLVPRPNLLSLFVTQYILEVVMNDPAVIEVYGTDQEIYKAVNRVITAINQSFERAEEEINQQLAKNKSLVPGSREYDIALDQIFREKMGEPQQI